MDIGKAIGTACSSFAITNIDDVLVLITFFAESSISKTLTPLKIIVGQYIGFTVIITISMIGFAIALVLPSEPIGFLGLLPILLGVWKFFDLLFPTDEEDEVLAVETKSAWMKSTLKVSVVTIMNGGDNIGTYVPLFSQVKGVEIAIYIITFYILLGVWCLVAYLVLRQRHVLRVIQRYAQGAIPVLYVGLGIYIVVKAHCYPWSIEHIDRATSTNPGETIMAVTTALFLASCIGVMVFLKLRKQSAQRRATEVLLETASSPTQESIFSHTTAKSHTSTTERLHSPVTDKILSPPSEPLP